MRAELFKSLVFASVAKTNSSQVSILKSAIKLHSMPVPVQLGFVRLGVRVVYALAKGCVVLLAKLIVERR